MKQFFILLTLVVCASTARAQYGYTINVQPPSEPKEVLSGMFSALGHTYDVSIVDQQITFTTNTDFGIAGIEGILQQQGIYDAQVTTFKGRKSVAEKLGNENCATAQILCTNDVVSANSTSIGYQELNNDNNGCLNANEREASWYYVNIQTGGSLVLRINPVVFNDDYDFAVWGPFTASNVGANCPPQSGPIRCSYSSQNGATGLGNGANDNSEGAGGDKWVAPLNVSANQIYIIYVDNYSASGVGYTMSFDWGNTNGNNQSTAVLGCTPVTLPVGLTSFEGVYQAGANVLTWTTESEQNNNYYTLEWSATGNGNDWKEIQKIQGAGTSETEHAYTAYHTTYQQDAFNYYRLSQIDFDGSTAIIDRVIVVDNRLEGKRLVKTINLLGQEVKSDEKGVLILIYEDGTQEKRFN